ncbi:motility associated factor glycosyltransferase family protein [Brevibacillus sp. SYP-B805]|uniref:motility associated factor glycosyltransferase family protein n=1 Tax=Brevibacillus sp. SYP-B805 TaxID=1578199 RepID=UPI0013ECDD06|nr:6-hydroxymethylpterin diphosphokinase MptE-like protein [Brevibacillus sp. SYP-B805]NGQ95638.1 motility associated factor glycosyltransferase family protein [Brevibacillus sp. SYP-B805]
MNLKGHLIQRRGSTFPAPSLKLETAKNGAWTAVGREAHTHPFYLHSRYDPVTEAERFIEGQLRYIEEELPEKVVMYGAGCGHHIKALLKHPAAANLPIEVWEANVNGFLALEEAGVYQHIFEDPRVTFVIADDVQIYTSRMEDWGSSAVHFIVHEPSLRAMPPSLDPLKQVLQDYQIKKNSAVAFRHLLDANFAENMKFAWPGIVPFLTLPSVPVLLISAGPSLQFSFEHLHVAKEHCLLGAVGSAAAPLHSRGITPDFVVMIDPQPNMLRQLEGWHAKDIPLFFLSTLFSDVVKAYSGPKYILFQEGYTPAEEEAARRGEPLVKTGGSVSTTLFSLARLFGLQPICLVGQDLAYTHNATHVEGSNQRVDWSQEAKGETVLSFDQKGTVVTSRNLLLYKKWFEKEARSSEDVFYNATEGGAYIEGFSHVRLKEFIDMVRTIDVSEAREQFRQIVRSTTS